MCTKLLGILVCFNTLSYLMVGAFYYHIDHVISVLLSCHQGYNIVLVSVFNADNWYLVSKAGIKIILATKNKIL